MRRNRAFYSLLVVLMVVPLMAMALLPLADTTEPRYAAIARLMAESGDWITLWYAPGVPFWGKPPLSFWAQAISFRWLGVNDFAPRFPSWLVTIATLWVLHALTRLWFGHQVARYSVVVYASCALVFITSGAVLTDPYLALGTTLAMAGPIMAGNARAGLWRYSFFLGVAIGLLAKGPLALVLIAGGLLPWLVLFASARKGFARLPWVSGSVLVAATVIPWYVLAELETPGFLDYFLVGEHIRRFLDPGWAGDLYGTAHKAAYGTIWYYWLQATFPWGIYAVALLLIHLFSASKRLAMLGHMRDERIVYLLGWAIFTPLFFTVSGNVLWTYLLPALPAFSVLVALALSGKRPGSGMTQPLRRLRLSPMVLAMVAPVAIIALVVLTYVQPERLKTEKWLVRYAQQHAGPAQPLYYLDDLPFSARFYSQESAMRLSASMLPERLSQGGLFWLAVPKGTALPAGLDVVAETMFSSRNFDLMQVMPRYDNHVASKTLDPDGFRRSIQ